MPQVELPNLSKLETEGSQAIESAKQYVCKTEDQYLACTTFFKWVKARKKEIKEEKEFKELIAQKNLLHKMHSDASTLEKKILKPYDDAETAIEDIMRPYVLEQKRKEQEEKDRLQKIADAQAAEEKELLRMQAEIEGRPEEAAIIEDFVSYAPEVKVEKFIPKTDGMSTRNKWKWEVVDQNLIPDSYWLLDTVRINKLVNSLGDKADIPGVKVIPDVSFSG